MAETYAVSVCAMVVTGKEQIRFSQLYRRRNCPCNSPFFISAYGILLTKICPHTPVNNPATIPDIISVGKYTSTADVRMTSIATTICPILWNTAPHGLDSHRQDRGITRLRRSMPQRQHTAPPRLYKKDSAVPLNILPRTIRTKTIRKTSTGL